MQIHLDWDAVRPKRIFFLLHKSERSDVKQDKERPHTKKCTEPMHLPGPY